MTDKKKLALVTGASRGIGAAIARALAADGFHVFVNFVSNEARAREVVEQIQRAGGTAEPLGFDIAKEQEIERAFDWIAKERGPLDTLVNNAGIVRDALILRMKSSDLDAVLDTNLKGALYCCREAAKQMLRNRSGSMIFISSVSGQMGNAGQTAYAAAKAGMIGVAKTLARELASRKICVNVVTPGYIQTDMTESLTDAQKEAILHGIPLGTLGTPEDVANLVAFLASPRSRYVTGQVIGVNGGLYI